MTSAKKAQANRQNALKSTGPKTPEGKAAVRLNAVRHGLLSREVLLPSEDDIAFTELNERLGDELQPVGEMESLLVDRFAPPTGGYAALAGWKPVYSPGNSTESWLNGPNRRLARTKKLGLIR
jgi:hypothetical protein